MIKVTLPQYFSNSRYRRIFHAAVIVTAVSWAVTAVIG